MADRRDARRGDRPAGTAEAAGDTPGEEEPSPEIVAMSRFFNAEGYDADIAALREIHPGLRTLERWLRENDWEGHAP